jgi:hypothetical protein
MARQEPFPSAHAGRRSPGYSTCLLQTDDAPVSDSPPAPFSPKGRAKPAPKNKGEGGKPDPKPPRRAISERLVLAGADRYVVVAFDSRIQCYRYDQLPEDGRTIPTEVDPATGDTLALGSDDILLQNNNAQKNVFDFEAAT